MSEDNVIEFNRVPGTHWDDEEIEMAQEVLKFAESVQEAAAKLGVTPASLRKAFKRRNLPSPSEFIEELDMEETSIKDSIRVYSDKGWHSPRNLSNKKHLIIPDAHAKPGVDNDRFEWLGRYIYDEKPDVVVCIGDFADMESLSSYDKGKKSFEGRRYLKDIEAAVDAQEKLFYWVNQMENKPRMVMCIGNHECVSLDTEILTNKGWMEAGQVYEYDMIQNDIDVHDTHRLKVASFDENMQISFNKMEAISKNLKAPMVYLVGDLKDELVSLNHNIFVDGELKPVREFLGQKIKQTRFNYAGFNSNLKGLEQTKRNIQITDEFLRVLTWTIMDGTIWRDNDVKKRVQFKLSKPRKIERLEKLLKDADIEYTKKPCKKYGINKLQPFYIRIYGQYARKIDEALNFNKAIPEDWKLLNNEQMKIVVEELEQTDGARHYNHITWKTTSESNAELMQFICVNNGFPCKITESGYSGFENGKTQYRVDIFDCGVWDRRYVEVQQEGFQDVIAIQTKDGTLITRRNGKVNFTGNSRINRVSESSPEFDGLVKMEDLRYEEFGWETYKFLDRVVIDEICYSHFFTSGVMNRAISGEHPAASLIKKQYMSCTQGHSHTRDFAERTRADGKKMMGLVCGCYFEHDEHYATVANSLWWRGLVMKRHVNNGEYEPEFVPIEALKAKYGRQESRKVG